MFNLRNRVFLILLIISSIVSAAFSQKYAIAIHGGAGNFTKESLADLEKEYQLALEAALAVGDSVLSNDGTCIDAVEQTIIYLENNPLFNAGKGAVMTFDKRHQLDASIMEGKNLEAGSVAGVSTIKNPISAARKVMEDSPHVILSGNGADDFAKTKGIKTVSNDYFFTEKSRKSLKRFKEKSKKMGTVGCIALDKHGNLAAGTSTGGMKGKRYGRIGDSPIIGAGTYADNNGCAVSCTGHGEFFIRLAIAFRINSLILFAGKTLSEASDIALKDLTRINASGGFICLNKSGNIQMRKNTSGMFRAFKKMNEKSKVYLY